MLTKEDKLYCLVKFGQEKYLDRLLKFGELYFNNPEVYNQLSESEIERGDINEGASWIENAQIAKINVNHPTLGEREFNPIRGKLSKIIQYNYNFLSYSLYAITPKIFDQKETHYIDREMLEFGDSAVLITEPIVFLKSVFSALKDQSIPYDANIVDYRDLVAEGRFELNPFIKKIEHQHHNELRIIIDRDKIKNNPIKIGSIEKYSHLVSSKSMIETKWGI